MFNVVRRFSSSTPRFWKRQEYNHGWMAEDSISSKEAKELIELRNIGKAMGIENPCDRHIPGIAQYEFESAKAKLHGKLFEAYKNAGENDIPELIKPALLEAFQWQHKYVQTKRKERVEMRRKIVERSKNQVKEIIKDFNAELEKALRESIEDEDEFKKLMKSYRMRKAGDEPYAPTYPEKLESINKKKSDDAFWMNTD